jgi:DnaK suppressor protein
VKKPTARPVRPAKLDAAALRSIREELEGELSELQSRQDELEKEAERQSDLREAGVNDDFADAGTATFDRERDFSIRNNIRDLIDQITRALRRVEDGSYGSCERCGKPIDAARLKALPHALLCMDCKRREERAR